MQISTSHMLKGSAVPVSGQSVSDQLGSDQLFSDQSVRGANQSVVIHSVVS